MADLGAVLNRSLILFQAGKIEEAARGLRSVARHLRSQPLASHVLGLCEFQLGNREAARPFLRQALDARPPQADFFANYATLLLQGADPSGAFRICERGLALLPGHVQLQYIRAMALNAQGRPAEALSCLDELLQGNPCNPLWLTDRGVILAALGRHGEAAATLERAAHLNPKNWMPHHNLSKLYLAAADNERAIASARAAVACDSENAQARSQLALALASADELVQSLEAHDRAVGLAPGDAIVLSNRGVLHERLGNHDKALVDFERAMALRPNDPDVLSNCANTLVSLKRYCEAEESFDRAIILEPQHAKARFNRSLLLLSQRRYDAGWNDYDCRLSIPENDRHAMGPRVEIIPHAQLMLSVERLRARKVVVVDEQGVGDTIMLASILPDLLAVAAQVELLVDSRLVRLMSASFPQIAVKTLESFNSEALADKVLLFIGSLGYTFRSSSESFPDTPYLKPDQDVRRRWAERLGALSARKKIGISWRGGTARTRQASRSLELREFRPLMSGVDADFVCLQYGYSENELRGFEADFGIRVACFPEQETHDLHDLAALISSLSSVVTVQNTNVHVAGAVGTPCLALIPAIPEWRYGVEGTSMPWYGSIELFRREASGSSQGLMTHLSQRLSHILGQ